jgi:23S rRNA (cytosine1962-C5)-methyltransferase
MPTDDRPPRAIQDSEAPSGSSEPWPYRVRLAPGRERSVLRRHPWIFSGAIATIEALDDARPGDLGLVLAAEGRRLGVAYVNPQIQLVARMLRWEDAPIDRDWFAARIAAALELRARLVPPEVTAVRLINGEGDRLPGLIADRYADVLAVQCLTLGMSRLEPLWLPELVGQTGARSVVDRSAHGRGDANLGRADGLLAGEEPPERVVVAEHGVRWWVDLASTQKTGFYIDQRENRRRLGELAAGRRVLNAFAYTGGFGLAAGARGAAAVVDVDTSSKALVLARENWSLNELPDEQLETVHQPAQEYLRGPCGLFDVIILDPPAFAKEPGHVARATRAYKDVNLWALKRLAPGGYLATFSCSQHVDADLFQKIIFGASVDAGRPLQWVARLGAGPDHPVHLDHPQGEYLKGLLLRATD